MKKKKQAQKSIFSFVGYLLFFVLVAGVATCSILAYSLIYDKTGGNKLSTAIITLVVLLLIALLVTIADGIRRRITVRKPVESIVEATEKITNGDFDLQLVPQHSYGKYNEFDVIMENINRMTKELSKNEVLKTDFIANVSHEIKTPLAVIENYATALGHNNLSLEQREEYTQILIAASKRLSDLISNILKLNKLENQEIFPKKLKVDLSEQLRECLLDFEEKFEEKGLEIVCNIDDAEIVSDSGFLAIIWNNLLSNAIKFTQKGGKITVSLKNLGNSIIVSVSDTGCGIPPEAGTRIFDKFYQADTSHSTEGNGLGLALVKRVIDILGGEISIESQPDVGSKFTIKLIQEEE